MRYKVVPEPADWDLLVAARDALPLVPGSVEDCCTRVRDRSEVPSREDAREIRDVLAAADRPLGPETVFERVRAVVPRWERDRDPGWEATWEDRVATLLAWGVVFGVFEQREGAYTLAD
ncbi:hypothetical protein BRD09_03480 [Halobacteriales archaeon SW_10_68_16]|nr:MAG: hypothetical protein BRD09_03480 [Halobacteriales archaeon SW_10_68_16]